MGWHSGKMMRRLRDNAVRGILAAVGVALIMVIVFYLWVVGGRQDTWTEFFKDSITITSLLLTFSGVLYFEATKSLNDNTNAIYEESDLSKHADLRTLDVAQLQGKAAEISNLAEKLRVKDLKSGDMGRYFFRIFISWGLFASIALYFIIEPAGQQSIPVDSVLFGVAVLAMYFQAAQFALFGVRAQSVIAFKWIDAKIVVMNEQLKIEAKKLEIEKLVKDIEVINKSISKQQENAK